MWRRVLIILAAVIVLAAAAAALALWGTGYGYAPLSGTAELKPLAPSGSTSMEREVAKLRSELKRNGTTLQRKIPRGTYIVIDQTNNRLHLMQNEQLVHEATCSAGSGMVLQEAGGGRRRWVFDTPRGAFAVIQRVENPVWKKPDWAFVEEGQPIPKNESDRFEYGSLGEYALYFGNGYMVHGTLYERLLGRSVTHGCIRLGRDDLRKVWASCPVGTRIFIY